MKEFLHKLPKTTITAILSAVTIYLLNAWYEAQLISWLLVAFWFSVNLSSGKFK